jgi:hypothetical protein
MLRQVLPEALHLDLLDASLYLELSRDTHRLEAIIGDRPKGACIWGGENHPKTGFKLVPFLFIR